MSRKNPNRQGFLNRVEDIRHMESDVDRLLDAARLKRIESGREPLKPSDIIKIAAIFAAALVFCTVLILGYLGNCFIPSLIGIGLLTFIGGALLAACC